MSKIKVGDHVQLVSTSWTRINFGITDCMPCSGKFIVEEIDGFKVILENLCNSWHINDFRLLKYPANHLDHIKQLKTQNRVLSSRRKSMEKKLAFVHIVADKGHYNKHIDILFNFDNLKLLNALSEKIGSNGLKIRSLRQKIKYGE